MYQPLGCVIAPVATRMIGQWPAFIEYFIVFVPKKSVSLIESFPFKDIAKLIKPSNFEGRMSVPDRQFGNFYTIYSD
jgi:hypothetical protein